MGYGESQAYREGMYKTDFGYSFYPPNEDEEENDMAVEECSSLSVHVEALCTEHYYKKYEPWKYRLLVLKRWIARFLGGQ